MPTKTAKGPTLYFSTHNLSGIKPPIIAFRVFNPKNHRTQDGKPMVDKIDEFQKRGLLKVVAGNSKVGSHVDPKALRNEKGKMSEGVKSRGKK